MPLLLLSNIREPRNKRNIPALCSGLLKFRGLWEAIQKETHYNSPAYSIFFSTLNDSFTLVR